MSPLDGKIAVVTGARQGLGEATARRLARDGATVVVTDVQDTRELAEALGQLTGRPHHAEFLDVTDGDRFAALLDEVAERHGALDVLVNNAGVSQPQLPLTETTDATYERVMAVNARGVFNGVRAAGRIMAAAGGGRIVNIASYLGKRGLATFGVYSASKGAVISLTQVAAEELGPSGVTVNAVCPGTMVTQLMLDTLPATTGEENPDAEAWMRQYARDRVPVGRMGRPVDVAALVSWLASDDSAFMTGAALNLTGGEALYF
ncbi:2-hydroxycyclohexane-1-carbonyl-CoA dehydrogenase [Acrocarpospora pleiomorpha]|uniref:2-hydroxycyclohexane-1-carbonyl-CoA dehydrogenase n=1 Tax=Acrocarpospora pleiomorpha TaxID=90975 RepID=A0A5M3X7Y4_9ACTN|nr:SDR family NAD(P)-dependent oxidoreductase [Acrocarpospora pleiomorpha]GES17210.1 2-hydroxycyclohexane-1-carbonyl-CoA dehydrogenase [Acrocarpospora pleiomorpha]